MTQKDFKDYITQRIIPDLQEEGFTTAFDAEGEDDYVTLTIHRQQRYY